MDTAIRKKKNGIGRELWEKGLLTSVLRRVEVWSIDVLFLPEDQEEKLSQIKLDWMMDILEWCVSFRLFCMSIILAFIIIRY